MRRYLIAVALLIGACGGSGTESSPATTTATPQEGQSVVATTAAPPTTAVPTTIAPPTTTTTEPDFLATLSATEVENLRALCAGEFMEAAIAYLEIMSGNLKIPPEMLAAVEDAGDAAQGPAIYDVIKPECDKLGLPATSTDQPAADALPDALLNGTYVAALDSFTGVLAAVEPFQRTFTFVTDCSTEPCTITGSIEHAVGIAEVDVTRQGDNYVWEFDNVETFVEDGVTLCEWGHHLTYQIAVTAAESAADLWTAATAAGTFTDSGVVLQEAANVDCGGGDGGGSISIERNG